MMEVCWAPLKAVVGSENCTKLVSRDFVETAKKNFTIDWILRENALAQLRVIVKYILRKYGYLPDKSLRRR